jgi:hypothetical protein
MAAPVRAADAPQLGFDARGKQLVLFVGHRRPAVPLAVLHHVLDLDLDCVDLVGERRPSAMQLAQRQAGHRRRRFAGDALDVVKQREDQGLVLIGWAAGDEIAHFVARDFGFSGEVSHIARRDFCHLRHQLVRLIAERLDFLIGVVVAVFVEGSDGRSPACDQLCNRLSSGRCGRGLGAGEVEGVKVGHRRVLPLAGPRASIARDRRGRRGAYNPCGRAGLFVPIARPYLAALPDIDGPEHGHETTADYRGGSDHMAL